MTGPPSCKLRDDRCCCSGRVGRGWAGPAGWSGPPISRASRWTAGDLMEARRGPLIALMQAEGGKTLDDAVAELREAVDFCRYYAAEARTIT